jgi:L-erythro-3,5-diaminohexanoate dehydrogenase
VLPQAALRLDASPTIRADEVRVGVERLNLDAASFRQLLEQHHGDGEAVRRAVLEIITSRGKMHNPVTGSGGMLIGTVEEVGPGSPLGLRVGQRIATLVSLTCTPLQVRDGLRGWDGLGEQVPCEGHAILFGRSIAAVLPEDLPAELALAVLDVCGAPALTARVLAARGGGSVCVIGAAGKSGSLCLAAARAGGASRIIGVVPDREQRDTLMAAAGLDAVPIADRVVVADARDPVGLARELHAVGGPVDVTVVCVDVPGCEHAAVLATAEGGTVIFFSMATSFTAAALGAEALAADVTMLIGNGYSRGHADLAFDVLRGSRAVRSLFETRVGCGIRTGNLPD